MSETAVSQKMQKLGVANTLRLMFGGVITVTSVMTAAIIALGVDPALAALTVPAVATLPLIWGATNE